MQRVQAINYQEEDSDSNKDTDSNEDTDSVKDTDSVCNILWLAIYYFTGLAMKLITELFQPY